MSIIGLGLIGSSVARAVRARMPTVRLTGHDADPDVREIALRVDLLDDVTDTAGAAVTDADLVVLCVPVGAMGAAAAAIRDDLPADAIVTDVGGAKESVAAALRAALPAATIVPGHPVAGTEHSGPEAGFATLFHGRWCILTPEPEDDPVPVARLRAFWEALGANVEIMTPRHHDLVLAVTSHVPHLIAYSIVGTASDLEEVTRGEVVKFSAGGFRDFTRIAASDPTMWRDVFLNNRDAVLEILQRLTEDVTMLQRAIRWGDGDTLFDLFTRTRAIRRGIIEQGQDTPAADFGRGRLKQEGLYTLFTAVCDFRGGTYISQVKASGIAEAVRTWAVSLEEEGWPGSNLVAKVLAEPDDRNEPVALQDVTDVWTVARLVEGDMMSVNFVRTG